MTNTKIFTEFSSYSKKQTIIDGVAALETTHEEAAERFFSLISLQKMLAKCLRSFPTREKNEEDTPPEKKKETRDELKAAAEEHTANNAYHHLCDHRTVLSLHLSEHHTGYHIGYLAETTIASPNLDCSSLDRDSKPSLTNLTRLCLPER